MMRRITSAMTSREVAVTGPIVGLVMTHPSSSFVETSRRADATERSAGLLMSKNHQRRKSMMFVGIFKWENVREETIVGSSTSVKMMIQLNRCAKISKMAGVLEEISVDFVTLMSLLISKNKWLNLGTSSMTLG